MSQAAAPTTPAPFTWPRVPLKFTSSPGDVLKDFVEAREKISLVHDALDILANRQKTSGPVTLDWDPLRELADALMELFKTGGPGQIGDSLAEFWEAALDIIELEAVKEAKADGRKRKATRTPTKRAVVAATA